MDQLKGSLRFIPLPTVTQFIVGLGSTGHLKLNQGAWSGELTLRDGQIVGAQFGPERGRAALESMVLVLTDAEFAFLDGVVDTDAEPIVAHHELAGFLAGLVAERERIQIDPGAMNAVPQLIDSGPETSQVTIQASALQLIPLLGYGHTVEQIAQRRGLARTLRELAHLREGGLVRVEPARPTELPNPTPVLPAARPLAAKPRPLRPVTAEGHPISMGAPRRATWWQASSAAPAMAQMPRPRLVNDESKLAEVAAPVQSVAQATGSPSWRKAVRSFFIAEPAPQG